MCGCVQTFAHLDRFGQEPVDEEVVEAAIGRLQRDDLGIAPRLRHLELALAHLNLGQPLDALFHLRLAARLKQHPPLRKLTEHLAKRYEP